VTASRPQRSVGVPISARSRISLGTRLIIVTAVITLALASVGALLAWRNQREERDRVHEDTATYAEARAMNVNQYLADRLDLLGAVAVSPVLRAGNVEETRGILDSVVGSFGSIRPGRFRSRPIPIRQLCRSRSRMLTTLRLC
jgi:hypothetical protein